MKKSCFILLMFILTFMYAFVVLCDTSDYHQGYYVVKNAFFDTNGDSFSNEYDWESLAWRDANDCMPCFRIDAIRDNRVWGSYRDGDYSEEIKFEGTAIKNNIINIETKNISMYDILNKERNGEDTNYSFVFDFKNIYSDNAINVNVKSSQIDSYTNKRFDSNNNYNLKLVNDDVIIFYELKQRIGEIKDVVLKNNSIKVILNGKELSFEQSPYIENGTTRVPMRYISEALGSEVNYNAQTKTITIRKGSTIIELITGSNKAKINGREMTLTTPVENRNGYTMVPLRFISEAFGAEVIWDETNKVITINLAEKENNGAIIVRDFNITYPETSNENFTHNSDIISNLVKKYTEYDINTITLSPVNVSPHNINNVFSKQELSNLLDENFSDVDNNDISFVYYGGHSLVTYDGKCGIMSNGNELLSFVDFYMLLEDKIKNGTVFIILDCCYSGKIFETDINSRFHIITATKADQESLFSSESYVSFENFRLGQSIISSIFYNKSMSMLVTDGIEDALKGSKVKNADADKNGKITVNELYNHINRYLNKLGNNGDLNPQIYPVNDNTVIFTY